ncbi:MAG: sugar transferase, partial [Ruminococcus sp.]|nr:sugar transferase [Ruminococcus sp.]
MNNAEKFKRLIMFMTSLVLICALTLCYSFVWIKYYNKSSPHFAAGMFYLKGNVLLYGVYALMFMLFSRIYKGYRIGFLKLTDIVYSQCLSLVCVNVITYFQICLIARLMFNPLPIVIMTVVQAFVICVWAVLSNRLFSKLYPPKKMVIVYGSRLAVSLVEKMCARDDRFCICRSIRADEDFEEIKRVIMEYEAVIICDIPGQRRNDILKFCFANSKRTYITPKISDIIIRGAEDMNMFDTPLLLCRNSGLNAEQAAIKRFMDIILSLIALVVLSPFMLITAAAIKLYDHGPVFYTQDRLTVGGR